MCDGGADCSCRSDERNCSSNVEDVILKKMLNHVDEFLHDQTNREPTAIPWHYPIVGHDVDVGGDVAFGPPSPVLYSSSSSNSRDEGATEKKERVAIAKKREEKLATSAGNYANEYSARRNRKPWF